MALALTTLAAVEEAGKYEGPSIIHLTDPHLLELLQIRYVRAKLCMTALGRIHNRILSALAPKISFLSAAAQHRSTKDPPWDQPSLGVWIAYQGAMSQEQSLPRAPTRLLRAVTHGWEGLPTRLFCIEA